MVLRERLGNVLIVDINALLPSSQTTALSGNSNAACGLAAMIGVPAFGLPNRKSLVGRSDMPDPGCGVALIDIRKERHAARGQRFLQPRDGVSRSRIGFAP